MNSHIGLQARVHDYEEHEKRNEHVVLRAADANEEQGEVDTVEASAEADIDIDVVEGVDEEDEPAVATTHHDVTSATTCTDMKNLGESEILARSKSAVSLTNSDGEGQKTCGTTPSTEWVRYLDDV